MHTDSLKVVRELPVPMSDEEKIHLGEALAGKLTEENTLKAKKTSQVSACNESLKEVRIEIEKLRKAVETGAEQREVQCEEYKDLETNEIVLVRLDTDEEVHRRPIGEDEREPLFEHAAKEKKKRNGKPAPEKPLVEVEGVDEHGNIYVLSAEQADAVRIGLKDHKSIAIAFGKRKVAIVKLQPVTNGLPTTLNGGKGLKGK